MKNRHFKSIEERVDNLELGQACIRELNREFEDMHRASGEIERRHFELIAEIERRLVWLNAIVTALCFATAGLCAGLLDSHVKLVRLNKTLNEG